MVINKQLEQIGEGEKPDFEHGLKEGVGDTMDVSVGITKEQEDKITGLTEAALQRGSVVESTEIMGDVDIQKGWYRDLENYLQLDLPWGLVKNEAGELVPPAAERLEALGITTPEKYKTIVEVSQVLGCDIEKLMASVEANPEAMKSILDTTYGQDATYYNGIKNGMSYINSFADHFAKAESKISDAGGGSYLTYNPEAPLKNIDEGYDKEKYQKLYSGIVDVFAKFQSDHGLYKDAGINAFYTEYNMKYGTHLALPE